MFKRLLILGSFAALPVAAMGSSPSSGDMQALSVQAGQGGSLTIAIPASANVQPSVQAPYALIGSSSTDTQPEYRQMIVGQGGMVQVQTD